MKLMQRLSGFARAKKGSAALEFAIIAPMMIMLLFGSVDLLDVLNANKRVQNVAASLADVVARDTAISADERDGLWAAIDVLMFPTGADDVDVRISSIMIESSSTARVVWSSGHGMDARSAGTTISGLPAAMMRQGTSVILAETSFQYESPLGFLLPDGVTLTHEAYRRSRLVDPIPCTWGGCS
jgi:Flp pilus assembly protein TadG